MGKLTVLLSTFKAHRREGSVDVGCIEGRVLFYKGREIRA